MHVSVSDLISWWECPRRWRLAEDYPTPQTEAQQKGDWVHGVFQALFEGGAQRGCEGLEETWCQRVGTSILTSRPEWWVDEVQSEASIRLPLLGEVELRGRLDGLAQVDGRATILEIKYSERPPEPLAKPWQSPQTLLYGAMVLRAFPQVKDVTARYILVGPQKADGPGKRRTGEYAVEVVERPLHNTDRWWAWARMAAEEMQAASILPYQVVRPTFALHCNWCAGGEYFRTFCQPLEAWGSAPVQFRHAVGE